MKVQGKGRRQAHVISRVVMDITAFKVSHRVGSDKDTTALRAQKVERVTFHIGAMECYAPLFGLQGGGLFISGTGTATLTNTNVYSNEARHVCSPSALA